MRVSDFQQLYDITESVDIDPIDKAAYTVCHVFRLSEAKVDKMKPKKFIKKHTKAQRIIDMCTVPPVFGRHYKVNTDATQITFGQFVEVITWMDGGVVEQMHMIHASMVGGAKHKQRAAKTLGMNVRAVLPYVLKFVESFNKLIESYSGLFEVGGEVKDEKPHPFILRYGWIYQATIICDHFRYNDLNKVWELNVIEALNTLSYLKSKNSFDAQS